MHDYAIKDNFKSRLKNLSYMYNHEFKNNMHATKESKSKKGFVTDYEYDYLYVYQVINSYVSYILQSSSGYYLIKNLFLANLLCIDMDKLLTIVRKRKRGKKNSLKSYKKNSQKAKYIMTKLLQEKTV